MILLGWLIHCLIIFLAVAFFSLFERKLIRFFHNRTGPNKVSFIGLTQGLVDALKFFFKQSILPHQSNKLTYSLSPRFSLLVACIVWMTMPSLYITLSINYSLLSFFCLASIIVFSVLLAGWASNSKYSLIGRLRSVAQSISYESVFSTLLVLLIFIGLTFSIRRFESQSRVIFILLMPLWFICRLAESHRAPFDFRESESELVSGYNTEYSSANFAFVILSEYIIVLYSCILITYLFISFLFPINQMFLSIFTIIFTFLVTWVRITFCRFRYDMLMIVSWKVFLPFTLSLFLSLIFMLL
jgi:NADH:ubiquinone oxidoreductase subunit H